VYFNWGFEIIAEPVDAFSAALFAEPFLAPIYRFIVNPTRDRIVKITWVTNIMAAVLSYCIPFASYLFFAEAEAKDYVFRCLDQNAPEVPASWLAFLVL
jgi:hypothetical protein